jgi:NAD(P)-dependent dehydrogenase (short-subunit alcohol dehydrogenase family)
MPDWKPRHRSHAAGVNVDGIARDFSGSAGAETVIAKLSEVDVLVNDVGIFEPKPFAKIPDADWYRFFEINVLSGVRLALHYLTGMLGRTGRILFISSESGVQIPTGNGALRNDENSADSRRTRDR